MSFFAESLKKLRISSGLSMDNLAKAANVSKSMICKIERDEVQPTLEVAGRLAYALGKSLSELLHEAQPAQVICLRQVEQAVWEDARKIKRRNISPVFEGLKIEWLQVTLPPTTTIVKNFVPNKTGGEKCVLVTNGVLEIKINQEVYRLEKGDSLYFDALHEHEILNSGIETAEFYIVIKHPN